ncbi:MAG: hypothetical protein LUG99_03920 [Lachnospiraceae bacterium]|nr:hypothetical protein [Lachnospiraceae bacterium]
MNIFRRQSAHRRILRQRHCRFAGGGGGYCYTKHFVCNEQESGVYRDGVYTWMTEQTLRELYREAFRIAVEEYGATGIMTSYNRLGTVWSGGNGALLTGILREEWNFQGAVITDYSDHHTYMNGDQAIHAGGDLWMDGYGGSLSFARASYRSVYGEAESGWERNGEKKCLQGSVLVNLVRGVDAPVNVCPSIHVSSSVSITLVTVKPKLFQGHKGRRAAIILLMILISISTLFDERTGNPCSTYHTFSLVTTGRRNNAWTVEAIWQYCGDCFLGENKMRGEKIPDVELCDCVVKMEGSND